MIKNKTWTQNPSREMSLILASTVYKTNKINILEEGLHIYRCIACFQNGK